MQTSSNRRTRVRPIAVALHAVCGLAFLAGPALGQPVALKRIVKNANAVQTGVSGVGNGTGTLVVAGVSGAVKSAYLYWHGLNNSGAGAQYSAGTITFAGATVTGVSQGDASTNCWGPGSSRTYEADVTSSVRGNGTYAFGGMAARAGDSVNGASLVVVYDDGITSNNRDYVFYTGNDSSHVDNAFPTDASGWDATLDGIEYRGGTVRATVHAADGQPFQDATLSITTPGGTATFADTTTLWDGNSLRNEGSARAAGQGLYDVHAFDATPAFGATGSSTVRVSMPAGGDCLAMTALVFDLEPGASPFTTCAEEGLSGTKLTMCRRICETEQTPTTLAGLVRLYVAAYREQPACAR